MEREGAMALVTDDNMTELEAHSYSIALFLCLPFNLTSALIADNHTALVV